MMRYLIANRIAFRAIRRNLLRAALTVLGILIGVAAVVSVTALGGGARDAVSRQLDTLGSNLIIVFPENNAASGAHTKGAGRLTVDDGNAIKRDAVSIATFAPQLQARSSVVYGDSNNVTGLVGTSANYFTIRSWHFVRGGVWDEHDEAVKAKVCVVGETVRAHLFGTEDPVGHVVRIGRFPYRIVGLLEAKGDAFGSDQDDLVIMPTGSLRSRFMRAPPGAAGALMFQATSADTTDRAVEQIESILRQRHHTPDGTPSDFGIRTQKQIQSMQNVIYVVLTLLLVAAAAISLLVGGIGIMNIMLVSVTERTREIGIRMAIGAREQDIRTQFLVEAVVLSLLGGIAGAAIGGLAIAGMGRALGWPMTMSPVALGVSLFVSLAIGVAFGFFPARRASKLDPIVALRHE